MVKRYEIFRRFYFKKKSPKPMQIQSFPSWFHVICDSKNTFCFGFSIGYQWTFVFSAWTAKRFHRSEHLAPVRSIKCHCQFILWKMKYMLVGLSGHMYKQFTFHFVSVERGWHLSFFKNTVMFSPVNIIGQNHFNPSFLTENNEFM